MSRPDYKTCRSCGKSAAVAGPISHSRLCPACGLKRCEQNMLDLATHSGEGFARWRAGMAASVGAALDVGNGTNTRTASV